MPQCFGRGEGFHETEVTRTLVQITGSGPSLSGQSSYLRSVARPVTPHRRVAHRRPVSSRPRGWGSGIEASSGCFPVRTLAGSHPQRPLLWVREEGALESSACPGSPVGSAQDRRCLQRF